MFFKYIISLLFTLFQIVTLPSFFRRLARLQS